MINLISPPDFPDDDNDSPDGGGPPRRVTPLDAINAIQRRTALAEARIAAQRWACNCHKRTYVGETAARPWTADDEDIETYHQHDLDAGRAQVAWTAEPTPPLVAAPDVAFAPAGWAE